MKILSQMEYAEIIARLDNLEKAVKEKQKSPSELIFDSQEFLQVMNISKRTAQTWRNERLIAYSQIEGKIYYKYSDIVEMINRHYVPVMKKKAS